MGANISSQINKLRSLSRQQLLELWQELYGKASPPAIRRELMVPFLAYRMQEKQYGGLKTSTRSELRRIAGGLDRKPSAELRIRPRIKPGTRLCRRWRGKMHEIFVTESGYEYLGVGYRSLSEVARKITGTQWSGPAFFGLKKINSLRGNSDD
jgi:Protein of unknown function (DUF2924)